MNEIFPDNLLLIYDIHRGYIESNEFHAARYVRADSLPNSDLKGRDEIISILNRIGKEIGFGAAQQILHNLWNVSLLEQGYPIGGAFNPTCDDYGWKTIDSAPKDGTEFDAWDSEYESRVANVFWGLTNDGRYSFVTNSFDGNDFCINEEKELSHWMPLPSSPFE